MTITYEYHSNLYVNLTNRCPNRCAFCLRTHSAGSIYADDLWLERAPSKEEILEDIKKRDLSQYRQLVFCGYGEPTCSLDHILASARYVKEKTGLPIRLNSNGLGNLYHKRDIVPELATVIDSVSISLNAPNAEEYDKVTRPSFPNAYAAMLDFAEECGRLMKHTQLSIVDVLPQEDIDACQKIADERGVHLKVRKFSKGA